MPTFRTMIDNLLIASAVRQYGSPFSSPFFPILACQDVGCPRIHRGTGHRNWTRLDWTVKVCIKLSETENPRGLIESLGAVP